MKINTIKYYLSTSLKNLKRNFTLSTASSATVSATLFILGVFLIAIFNMNLIMKNVGSTLEVEIFLKDEATVQQQNDIKDKINEVSGIENVQYLNKVDALNKAKEMFGKDNQDLTEGFEQRNPFSCSYIVKVQKPEIISKVVDNVKDMGGIDSIGDERKVVDTFISITRTLRWVGIGIFAILICVSVFLIENTIKLTVYSRRKEIGIMKYIGATDWFIRWPFILEGMMIGILGAVFSTILLYYAYSFIFNNISHQFITMKFIAPSFVFTNILLPFVLSGILIGSLGSILSIRKFLSV